MTKKQFKTVIKAAKNIVWHALWSDKFYRRWTGAFAEGSYAESDWDEGAEIRFLLPDGNGMYGVIAKMDEPNYIAFEHLGEIIDHDKQPPRAEQHGFETYRLTENDKGETEIVAELDAPEELIEFFERTFPNAFDILKEIAESAEARTVTVETTVNAGIETVWDIWTTADQIVRWNNASDDWHTPAAENDLRPGGNFKYRMEAKDKSMGFDFTGIYGDIRRGELIRYELGDGRKVEITFASVGEDQTKVVEIFEAETEYPVKYQ